MKIASQFSPLRTSRWNTWCWTFSVRLACVRHAASVRPEPGSNSPIKFSDCDKSSSSSSTLRKSSLDIPEYYLVRFSRVSSNLSDFSLSVYWRTDLALIIFKKKLFDLVLRYKTLDPHIRFFLGYMFSFQGSCLTILAFVLLPYRDDLYIIPRLVHPVNTFFASFSVFLRDTLGTVEKGSILYTRFQTLKIS